MLILQAIHIHYRNKIANTDKQKEENNLLNSASEIKLLQHVGIFSSKASI